MANKVNGTKSGFHGVVIPQTGKGTPGWAGQRVFGPNGETYTLVPTGLALKAAEPEETWELRSNRGRVFKLDNLRTTDRYFVAGKKGKKGDLIATNYIPR